MMPNIDPPFRNWQMPWRQYGISGSIDGKNVLPIPIQRTSDLRSKLPQMAIYCLYNPLYTFCSEASPKLSKSKKKLVHILHSLIGHGKAMSNTKWYTWSKYLQVTSSSDFPSFSLITCTKFCSACARGASIDSIESIESKSAKGTTCPALNGNAQQIFSTQKTYDVQNIESACTYSVYSLGSHAKDWICPKITISFHDFLIQLCSDTHRLVWDGTNAWAEITEKHHWPSNMLLYDGGSPNTSSQNMLCHKYHTTILQPFKNFLQVFSPHAHLSWCLLCGHLLRTQQTTPWFVALMISVACSAMPNRKLGKKLNKKGRGVEDLLLIFVSTWKQSKYQNWHSLPLQLLQYSLLLFLILFIFRIILLDFKIL